ncbi:PqqD family protein [Paenibacillus sp. Soil787]|uniref:PqqD family protein n=1 Tax=Paenibacillus sp. Soil787 TaxID=1736411 RepID=UPI0006FF3ADF|nr:PqqD family protein [Paenibacillus sp. Soil787]KRF35888.1 hypothetical protein ASG93_25740 [Paenibacillus sp. Soil787]
MSTLMNNTYRCSANLDMMEVDGEFLILDSNQLTVTKLNEMGGKLWGLLQQGLTLQQIITAIQDEYDINGADVESDVVSFLNELSQMGLVEHGSVR